MSNRSTLESVQADIERILIDRKSIADRVRATKVRSRGTTVPSGGAGEGQEGGPGASQLRSLHVNHRLREG